jgi:hypothetical protein
VVFVVGLVSLVWSGQMEWGFGKTDAVTRETTHSIDSAERTTDFTQEYRSPRTVWDVLQLLVIPLSIGFAGTITSLLIAQAQRRAEADRAQDEALRAYLDEMSRLLIDKELKLHEDPLPHGDTRVTARARTLTVLSLLDRTRKRRVLQFLREARLISRGEYLEGRWIQPRIVGLDGADLENADLRELKLDDTSLRKVNLRGADLREANLIAADLRGADLSGANLRDADLRRANLKEVKGVTDKELKEQTKLLSDATISDGRKSV